MTSIIVALVILLINNQDKLNIKSDDSFPAVKIIKIIDGDTFLVRYNDNEEQVRLIGIDTPENSPNIKAIRDSRKTHTDIEEIVKQGKEASKFVKRYLKPGDIVNLEFDIEKRDQFGRILAYVYLSDGTMINELIVREGYANLMTIPPNVKYQDKFVEDYKYARENNLGLWK